MAERSLTETARRLRKDMTKEERRLWFEFLRGYPVRVRRQHTIDRYIVDFYCAKAKLAIEVDGSQHYEDKGAASDAARTADIAAYGIDVLRIPNNEVERRFPEVCAFIDHEIKRRIGQDAE